MNYPQLYEHINQITSIEMEEYLQLEKAVELKKVKKKELILEPPQISKHMRFVISGCLRVYTLDENGVEKTLQLGIENWWLNDLYSYITEKPSEMYIQALEDSTYIQINKSHLDIILTNSLAVSNFFRIKMQNAYVNLQERIKEQRLSDAYARYEKFRKDYRDIEQRVPQYIIASYLDITPEFLSFLRKKHKT